jgi:acyl-CoA dehydrogenase
VDFALTEEQQMLVRTMRTFSERELYPHEKEIERLGYTPKELAAEIRRKARAAGLYALNMPEEFGGGGLDAISLTLADMEHGRPSTGLSSHMGRVANALLACRGDQIESYLKPAIRAERTCCTAITEPEAGSDARSMRTKGVQDGGNWVLSGTKQFISNADHSDFIVLYAVTGQDEVKGRKRNRISAFLVDKDLPGLTVTPLQSVSTRGYNPHTIVFNDVRIPAGNLLGEEGRGFDLAGRWLHAGRVMLAAMCVGRAHRVFEMSSEWAASRKQFGQAIGQFQGTGFKLADMATEIEAAEAMLMRAAWRLDRDELDDRGASIVNLYCSEMIGRVTDNAVQIFGGMGIVSEMPIERFWRDARIERIWEGTSEIQRWIIARDILRQHAR